MVIYLIGKQDQANIHQIFAVAVKIPQSHQRLCFIVKRIGYHVAPLSAPIALLCMIIHFHKKVKRIRRPVKKSADDSALEFTPLWVFLLPLGTFL